MTILPNITEKDIRGLVSQKIFERGQDYYRQGCIHNPKRQGNKIWSICYGSEIYNLSLTLGDHCVLQSHCDCPYDWGDFCKHQIALLLTYVHNPHDFLAIAPLNELLASYDRNGLISLIQQLVDAEPALLDLLQLAPAKRGETTVDLNKFALQAKQAFDSDSASQIVRHLQPLADYAASFMDIGDYVNAGSLYWELLEACNSEYNADIDYDGDVMVVVNDYVEGLGECVLLGDDEITAGDRQKWLEQLLKVFFSDLELGGMDYGCDATDYINRCATSMEWIWIENYCLKALERMRDWGRSQIVNFLGDRLSPDSKVKFLQQYGTPEQQIWAYIEIKDYQTAQTIALENFTNESFLIERLADTLIELGEDQLALTMITEFQKRQQNKKAFRYLEWLAKYYEKQNDLRSAINYGKQVLLLSHRFQHYQFVKTLLEREGNWDKIRPLLLAKLEQEEHFSLLTEIALDEKDLPRTLKFIEKQKNIWGFNPQKILAAKLAREQKQFDLVIAIYRDLVEAKVALKERKNYQVAAEYLKEIKGVFQEKNSLPDWEIYFREFASTYRRLPALMNECKQAELP